MEPDLRGAPMRIGIYFGGSYPEIGGAHTYLADLLRVFTETASSSEHRFILLCDPAAAHAIGIKADLPNVQIVPLSPPSRLARLFRTLKYFLPLLRYVCRFRGSVERIAHRYGVQLLWFVGNVMYECPDMPFIATMLDLQHRYQPFFPEVSARGEWDAREQFFGYSMRRATYCITGTETGKREIEYLYQVAEPRIRVLPLPTPKFALDAAPSTIDVKSRFGIDKYIFYPAQFWPHKNHNNLILALKWLKENKNLELTLVLPGSDKGNLSFVKGFAEQNEMAGKVLFPGFVSEEELVALYRQAVALTFMTYFGPDNIPPLEAFALGCPVIASGVPGAQEQYGDAVVRVNPSDPADIGQAIWNVYSDETLRSRLVQRGYERARKWTSADYVKEMLKLFDEFSTVRRNWL